MALPLLLILHLGRIIPIAVGVGTALARFVAKNPKNNRLHRIDRGNIVCNSIVCYHGKRKN